MDTLDKTHVNIGGTALEFARNLVETGEYPTLEEAISGVLLRMRDQRNEDRLLLEAEVRKRRSLPRDQWIEAEPGHFTRWFEDTFDESQK